MHSTKENLARRPLLKVLAALLVASPSLAQSPIFSSPTNIFAPASTPAKSIFGLSLFVIAISAAIFVVVGSLLTYVVVKFRKRTDDDRPDPAPVYGSNQVESAWTAL